MNRAHVVAVKNIKTATVQCNKNKKNILTLVVQTKAMVCATIFL